LNEEKKELVPLEDYRADVSESNEEYVIQVTGGGKIREIKLSPILYKVGIASIFFSLAILIGACGYSVYSAMNFEKNAATVREIQQAEEIQQEQLLTVSKKAAALSETLHNLTQQEQELRIQAGLKPPKEDKPAETPPAEGESAQVENNKSTDETPAAESSNVEQAAQVEQTAPVEQSAPVEKPPSVGEFSRINHEHNGQGGPINSLNIDEVSEALAMLEERVNIRQESLNDFQAELKQQREQLAMAATSAAGAGSLPGFSGATGWSPGTTITYDLSQFGGAPSADSHMPSIWPTTGVVTSPYGLRWGGSDFHPGIDIANDMGTAIVATADGVVDFAGWNAGGYGNMVDIDHGNGIMTRYGHASQVVVSAGQQVKRGQLIAYMGSTGFSTGPHVHYEIIINGQRVNPISYL